MEFEVSFRETLRQLADAQVRLNTMGKVLDTNAKKAGDMESATSRAANQIRIQFEQLNRYLDRNRLATNQMGNELAQAQKKAERAFLAMANSNMTATSKLQALNGELGNLDRLVKDTAQKKAYTKWLEKSAALSADMAGRSQHLRDRLASLDTAQARVNARLTEYVKAKERSLGADAKLLTSNRELQQTLERLDSVEGRRSVSLKRQLQDKRQEIGYIDSQVAKTAQLRREKEFLESVEGREQQRLRAQVSALKQVNTATEQLTQAKALENAQTARLINQVKLQNQLRNAEALASQKVTAADRRQTEALREQIREYERRAKLAAMSNAQLLGMSSSASKLSRDLHINAQAAAMFRAGLAGLNASIGIYTSATVLAATATYAIAAAMRDTVSVGIEFTDTMARAEAVMMTGSHAITEAGRSMEGMEMQVRALGASTMFTATQVSGALVELGMAGLSSTEAMTSLAPTLDLAAIGNVEMGRAADIATNVMTAFNKTAGEMTGVVDLLAYAITNSNTNLEQLANSISYVGPAAQAAGFGLEETVAAIQTLANAGIKGSRAGTGLRRMMVNLQNPTARGAKVIEDFNINLTNVDGTTRTLTDILANFNAEMAGVSDAERMAAIVDLFGVRASQSAARLIGASAEVANFRREMELAGGSAQAMREKIEDTLGADWKKLKSAFQDIQLDVFESFEQQLRSTTAEMTVFLAKQQEINEAMSLQAGFTPEQIASGEGISELEILIGTMRKALDIALRLGAAFVAFKTFKGATTAFAALSNQLRNEGIPRLEEFNNRMRQSSVAQRNAAMAAASVNSSYTAAAGGARVLATSVGVATATINGAAIAAQRAAWAISTFLGPITMVATAGYAIYSAVKYGFKDSEDYVLDHKARITELEAEYENLGNTIQQIEHTRSRRALEQRESDIRTEIEGIQAQIEVYEQLSATATGEYAEIYAARLSNLTHQLTEQEKALTDNIKAQERLGTSHEQQASVLAQIDTVSKELAEKMDELTAANERVAMGSRGATVQAVELQREVEGLKGQLADLNRTAEETAVTMVDVFDQMEIAVGNLREELNEEFRLEGLSSFEKLQEDTRLLNEAREETVELQRRVANGEVELGDSVRRNQEKVLELEESVARARRDNNLAMVEGQSAREEYLAHFLSEEDQIQAAKAKMEELNKEIAVMNALMAMGISVDGERWETLWEDLLTFQERYDQLTKEDSSTTRQRNQELEEALSLFERLKGSYDAVGMATETLNEEQGQLKYLLDNGKISAEDFAKASEELTKQYEASIDPLSDIRAELYPVQEAQRVYAENVAAIAEALAAGTIPQDKATDAIKHYGKELEKAVEEADPMKKRLKELRDAYDSNYQRTQKLRKDLADINKLHREGAISGEQYARMWRQINDEMWDVAMEANPAAQEMARSWEEASNRIDETFADAFAGAFDSFDDFADRLLDGFKRLLAELAYQATLKPIVVQFTQQMGGALGIPGYGAAPGMGQQPGGGFNLGSMGSLYNSATRLPYIGDAISSAGSALGFGGSSAAAGGLYANALTGSAAAGGLYAGASTGAAVGGLYGNALTGAATTAGGGFMSAASAAMPWLAGGMLVDNVLGLGIVDGIVGGISDIFGGGKSDPRLNISTRGDAGQFGHESVRTGAFGAVGFSEGTKRSNDLFGSVEAEREWLASVAALDNLTAAAARTPEQLDAMTSAVQNMVLTSGDAQGAIDQLAGRTAAATRVLDAELTQTLLDAGASAEQIAQRFATARNAVDLITAASERLNLQYDANADGALRYADSLVQAFGSVENIAAIQDAYYNAAFSDQERLQNQYDDVRSALSGLTDEAPRTVEELRALVEAQQLNGGASQQLAYDLMALAPALKEANAGVRQAISQQYQDVLGRAPDASGLEYWFDQVASGALTLEGALSSIANSAERLAMDNQAIWDNITSSLEDQYRTSLGRDANADDLYYWMTQIEAGAMSLDDALWSIANSSEAAEYAANGASGAINDMASLIRQREQLERQLLTLQGDTLELRRREMLELDPSLRHLQQRIWAIEDERAAMREAERAQQERIRNLEREARAMMSAGQNIRQFVESLQNTGKAGASPEDQFKNAEESFLAALTTIYQSDDDDLVRQTIGDITGIADDYLSAAEQWSGSGLEFQSAAALVESSLDDLADRLGAEEQNKIDPQLQALLDIVTNTGENGPLAKQSELGGQMGDLYQSLMGVTDAVGGVLTYEQAVAAADGLATNEELKAMFDGLDLNNDGIISKLESVVISSMPTDAILASTLNGSLTSLGSSQLTKAQVIEALSPIATDSEIARLITRLDTNADDIITAEELTAGKFDGLADGITDSVKPLFDTLDTTLDGLIDWTEFTAAFDGLATNEELKAMFDGLDLNNDGIISKLESVVISSMPTDTRLASALSSSFTTLGNSQLTKAQVIEALSPIATDSEIARLITRLDTNADDIITAEELTAGKFDGLADGIANSIKPLFETLDTTLDGLIDWTEFSTAFDGLGTDEELKSAFNAIDEDMDGFISKAEAIAANTGLSGPLAKQTVFNQKLEEMFGGDGTQNYLYRQLGALAKIEKAINELDLIVNVDGQKATVGGGSGGSNVDTTPSVPTGKTLTASQAMSAFGSSGNAVLEHMYGGKSLYYPTLNETQRGSTTAKGAGLEWFRLLGVAKGRYSSYNVGSDSFNKSDLESILGFSESRYLTLNPDVSSAISRGEFETGLQHFLMYGVDEGRKFAKGGIFTNSIVDSPTPFDMALMGEAGPEAIMPLTRGPDGALGVTAHIPNLGLNANGGIAKLLTEVLGENRRLRQDLNRLMGESNKHAAASVKVAAEGHRRHIEVSEKGNKSLYELEQRSRLEAMS